LALVAAIASYTVQNRWSQAKVSGVALFPGLAADLGKVARIEASQGGRALALARDKEGWVLPDRGGYPVKLDAVRGLLVKLAQAELVESKTRSKERHALLELEDPAGKDAKSRQLRLVDDKGGLIAAVIVGKKRYDAFGASKGGTYVRKPGDEQTWLSNAELDVSLAVRDWVQSAVLNLDADKVAKVTLEIPGEEPLVIERDAKDAKKHVVAGLTVPEGKKPKEGAGEDIVRAAASIDLEDMRKASATMAGKDVSVVRIEGDGGLGVTLRVRKEGEDTWVALEVSGAEGEAKKTADELAKRVNGWEFKISAGKAQSILRRRADLFQAS
jgi:hypothetical protein